MYVRIGILGRSADNIFIYFDVVFTYYSKEEITTTAPSRPRGQSRKYGDSSQQGAKFELKKRNGIKISKYFLKYKCYSKINVLYIHIGILGRSTNNIYIYINVVIAYYAKEDNG